MKRIVFDLETDNLLDAVTRIHSLVLRDLDTAAVISCADQPGHISIDDGLAILAEADLIIGHNIIKYDIPVLRKLKPQWRFKGEARDTMVLARFLWAHVEAGDYQRHRDGKLPGDLIGTHKLEAWGYRLGVLKGAYGKNADWSLWTPEMQRYCEQDTLVGKTLFDRCAKEIATQDCEQAAAIEHELAWYLAQMERNGVPFDMDAAIALQGILVKRREEIGTELRAAFGSWWKNGGTITPKSNRRMRQPDKSWHLGFTVDAPYTKLKQIEFNPTSRDHIANRLTALYGWEPTDFTDSGKPKVDEDTLEKLSHIPLAARVIDYLMLSRRLGQLVEGKQAWLLHATNTGAEGGMLTGRHHIHGSVNQNGAVTHRATHSYPNLAQVPKVGTEYGEDCRALFTVPKGWTMLGADASGLELRCLAHYMARYDNGSYGVAILEGKNEDGTDIHSVNRNALGLIGKEGRDKAKTFIYAWLYGAGDWKIGHTLDPLLTDDEKTALGKRKKREFLKNTPALKMLAEAVKEVVNRNKLKFITMPDGRRSYVRHDHAALNTLLQGAGAIICKAWIVEFSRRMTARFGPQGWAGKWAALLWIHDEIEVAVRPEIAEEAAQIAIESIRSITQLFNWRIPLDGEAKLGATWAEVH